MNIINFYIESFKSVRERLKSKILVVGFLLFCSSTILTYSFLLAEKPADFLVFTIALIVGIYLTAKTKYEIEGMAFIFSSLICTYADLIIQDPIDGIYFLIISLVAIYIFAKGIKEKKILVKKDG